MESLVAFVFRWLWLFGVITTALTFGWSIYSVTRRRQRRMNSQRMELTEFEQLRRDAEEQERAKQQVEPASFPRLERSEYEQALLDALAKVRREADEQERAKQEEQKRVKQEFPEDPASLSFPRLARGEQAQPLNRMAAPAPVDGALELLAKNVDDSRRPHREPGSAGLVHPIVGRAMAVESHITCSVFAPPSVQRGAAPRPRAR
jgi:predicted negative regulator of RcsB-dependent stress response